MESVCILVVTLEAKLMQPLQAAFRSQMEQQAFLVVVHNTVLLCCIFNCSSSAADTCDRPGQYKLGCSNAEEILV